MSVFSIGEVLRKQRISMGISQEDLCDGICSVPTLSRIENGERVPNKANFDALMQRMGQSGEMYDAYIGKNDFNIHEKKFYIRNAIMRGQYDLAKKLLAELKSMSEENDLLTQQFLKYMSAMLKNNGSFDADTLSELESAIKMTKPKYGTMKISDSLLTFDEITILNNIANAYAAVDNIKKAIVVFYELKEFMDNKYINSEEKVRTYPMILYNLSKWLGLEGRYDECIEICDEGIKLCTENGKTKIMSKILYNKAWSLEKKGKVEDSIEFAKLIMQAYYLANAIGNTKSALLYKKFGMDKSILLKEEYFM